MNFSIFQLLFVIIFISCGFNGYGQGQVSRPPKQHSPTSQPKKSYPKRVLGSEPDGYFKGQGYVDLGLPSGTKWATCNVGAKSPDDYGKYFAWGETTPKSRYESKTYKIKPSNIYEIGGMGEYDAATANWGNGWRMPTAAECDELIHKCTWRWLVQDKNNGYEVTGPNGKSIFLPAAGDKLNGYPTRTSSDGLYWSSESKSERDDATAIIFRTTEFLMLLSTTGAYIGGSIRAVLP